jgi:hypothetical protein
MAGMYPVKAWSKTSFIAMGANLVRVGTNQGSGRRRRTIKKSLLDLSSFSRANEDVWSVGYGVV